VDERVHEMSLKVSTRCHPFCPREVTYYVHEMSATHCQCPRSKLSKFRILPYSEIVVRGQNLKFQVICKKMAMFEQLNDQLLVNSK
jgi:hypothetical protein